MAKRIYSDKGGLSPEVEIFSIKSFLLTRPRKIKTEKMVDSSFMFEGMALGVCLNGRATLRINYREVEVCKNQIVVIMPHQIVTPLRQDKDTFMVGLFIGRDYLTSGPVVNPDFERMIEIGTHPVITFTEKQMENLMELHSVILTRHRNLNNPYTPLCLQGLIFSFLAEIGSVFMQNDSNMVTLNPSRQEKIAGDFFRLLIGNFKENRSVAFYADKLCYTPKYLSTVVKKVTGHTIQEWINEIVIMHAKSQLKTTDKTVLEISEEMNFSNPSFFGRFFKQYAGMTPQQFRKT